MNLSCTYNPKYKIVRKFLIGFSQFYELTRESVHQGVVRHEGAHHGFCGTWCLSETPPLFVAFAGSLHVNFTRRYAKYFKKVLEKVMFITFTVIRITASQSEGPVSMWIPWDASVTSSECYKNKDVLRVSARRSRVSRLG